MLFIELNEAEIYEEAQEYAQKDKFCGKSDNFRITVNAFYSGYRACHTRLAGKLYEAERKIEELTSILKNSEK